MVIVTRGVSNAAKANVKDTPVEEDRTVAESLLVAVNNEGDSVKETIAPPEENTTVTASEAEAPVEDSLLGYLHLVGSLEKQVTRSDDQSLALSSSNVSVQHRRRAVDVENSFVQGLAAIREFYRV
jgi:hypothetical protein